MKDISCTWWRGRERGARIWSPSSLTGFGAHMAFYLIETGVPLSLNVKRSRFKADLILPSDAEVKD
jgi:hypothetical protein